MKVQKESLLSEIARESVWHTCPRDSPCVLLGIGRLLLLLIIIIIIINKHKIDCEVSVKIKVSEVPGRSGDTRHDKGSQA